MDKNSMLQASPLMSVTSVGLRVALPRGTVVWKPPKSSPLLDFLFLLPLRGWVFLTSGGVEREARNPEQQFLRMHYVVIAMGAPIEILGDDTDS